MTDAAPGEPPPVAALRAAIDPALAGILAHPFVTGLADGTLPRDAFARYLAQNHLYLGRFARALAVLAARAPGGDVEFFARRAAYAIAAERAFTAEMAAALGVPAGPGAEPSPTCRAYGDFVVAWSACGAVHEALGAVLPCYLVYGDVSRALAQRGSPDPHYARWIAMYVDPGFAEGIRGALAACDDVGRRAGPAGVDGMARVAGLAARYEWCFWDAALRDERWPDVARAA